MPIPATETLAIGAIGGLVSLALKYVVDRFTESHKANLSVAAKRKERFHEKQASVIAGAYERLAKWTKAASEVTIYDFDIEDGVLSEWAAVRLKRATQKAGQAADDFYEYFAVNQIYLPPSLDHRFLEITLNLSSATAKPQLLTHCEPQDRLVTVSDIEYAKQRIERVKTLLKVLRERFYKLMLLDESPEPPTIESKPT